MTLKIENPEIFRANVQKKLSTILQNDRNGSNLEKGVFNYALKESERQKIVKKWDNKYFVQIYVDRLRSVMTNMNEVIVKCVSDGTIKAHTVAFMTHQELCPEKWQSLIDAKLKRDKNRFEVNIEASTDAFTCRKCKSKKCTYYQLQIRSADEGITTFVLCLDCNYKFRVN